MKETKNKKLRRISIKKLNLQEFFTDLYNQNFKKGGVKVDLYTTATMELLYLMLTEASYNVIDNYSNKSFSKYLKINTRKFGEMVFKISDHDSYPEFWNRLIEIKSNTAIEDIVKQLVYVTQDLFVFSAKKVLEAWSFVDESFYGKNNTEIVEFYFDNDYSNKNLEKFAEFVKNHFGEEYKTDNEGDDDEFVLFDASNITSFLQEKNFVFEKVIWSDYIDTELERDYVTKPNGEYYNCCFKIDFTNKRFWIEILGY